MAQFPDKRRPATVAPVRACGRCNCAINVASPARGVA